MKIWRGVLRLALILNVVVFAENNNHNTTDKGTKKNSILHKLWKREILCPDGEYRAVNHCCKHCNAGTYAKSDCEQEHGDPTCNNCIEGSTYMNTKNGEHSCRKCTPCDSVLEELSACTVTRDFVCKCKEDFFCTENITAEPNGCTQCQHCTKCEHGYAERCSSIKDAVCNLPSRAHYAVIIALVLIAILMLVVYCVCRKRCNPNYLSVRKKSFIFPEELKDIDLTNLLRDFAQNMKFTVVRNVVHKLGITETQIETIKRNDLHDNEEQKFQLLRTWYEGHGKMGAFQELIEKLQEDSKQRTVEKLIDIAREQRQQSQT